MRLDSMFFYHFLAPYSTVIQYVRILNLVLLKQTWKDGRS